MEPTTRGYSRLKAAIMELWLTVVDRACSQQHFHKVSMF